MEKFNFKKKFGQNFLKDNKIVESIVDIVDIKEDSLVIEVGPGKAILTKELSKKFKNVLCYEIDTDLEEYLLNEFNDRNVNIIFDDFLKRDICKDIQKYEYSNLYFISNVPYYITTPIIFKLLESKIKFEKIVMLVQKELGERVSAVAGTKDYNSLTVLLNYSYNIRTLLYVSRYEFIPVPNVDSVVIEFSYKKDKLVVNDIALFKRLIKDSFRFKRKTLKNNLKEYELTRVEEVLKNYGKTLSVRAEELKLEEFVDISNNLS